MRINFTGGCQGRKPAASAFYPLCMHEAPGQRGRLNKEQEPCVFFSKVSVNRVICMPKIQAPRGEGEIYYILKLVHEKRKRINRFVKIAGPIMSVPKNNHGS